MSDEEKPIPSPIDCFKGSILRWEGEFESDPHDSGNWVRCHGGSTKCIGTMRGVTAQTYAGWIDCDPCTITAERLQTEVTTEVAAEIYASLYYKAPGLVRCTWSPVIEVAADIAWGSGPGRGVKMLQSLVGTAADGVIGPQTVAAVDRFLEANDLESAVDSFCDARLEFYHRIAPPGSSNARFLKGWTRRAEWYSSANAVWFSPWAGWSLSIPTASVKPLGAA